MTREIPLTKGKVAIVDDVDYERFGEFKWHCVGGKYAARSVGGRKNKRMVYLHREVLEAEEGQIVDHINGDKLDNRKSNLRIVTSAENLYNTSIRSDNTSGYKGVVYVEDCNEKWEARIHKDGKKIILGRFETPEEAACAYNEKALELFGEYARLNEIKESV
ncbi:HNH endonuclease [Lederbergia citri]|uniref:HNH endonuclease n=1 Tax=Lederbergia citri TaxID=2833580 RepID=A0A942TCT6_9BACI|nr:HNH endonuclease [Lederbergia citri]MBS4195368.1 HNH endonuclease [Lederbergia citri]